MGADMPDYMRVSTSKMVAGWQAPNLQGAQQGALSAFNDVWHQRSRAAAASAAQNGAMMQHAAVSRGGMAPPAANANLNIMMGMGYGGGSPRGGGGGGQMMAIQASMSSQPYEQPQRDPFEGMSLAQVLASKPKKEAPDFRKKVNPQQQQSQY
jgi:hypothetical protein